MHRFSNLGRKEQQRLIKRGWEAEQKEFMKAFIERIEMFPEKRKDGSWIKKIVFNFPVPVDGEEVKELPLETEATVETVVLMSRK